MAIDVGQIHNLVRTYQRALHSAAEPQREAEHPPQQDRVSLSAEARERGQQPKADPPQGRQKA